MLLDLVSNAVRMVLVVVAAALVATHKAANGRVGAVLMCPQLAVVSKPNLRIRIWVFLKKNT